MTERREDPAKRNWCATPLSTCLSLVWSFRLLDEVASAEAAIVHLGGRLNRLIPVELSGIAETRYLVLVDKTAATPDKYPRRPGMPAKHPIK